LSLPGIAPARLLPRDLELLERRARALAQGEAEPGADEQAEGARLVHFRLAGLPCAVDAARVVRAVSRLTGATPVPTSAGVDRTVAFVEEQPLPVADLSGAATGAERSAAALSDGPALVLDTAAGPVAVAVEGPLDLREERLSGTAEGAPEGAAGLRLTGRLADGTSVLDARWLLSFAERAARP
jgi:chemotaxis signal transduction protein